LTFKIITTIYSMRTIIALSAVALFAAQTHALPTEGQGLAQSYADE
jgi:hypothetical protein